MSDGSWNRQDPYGLKPNTPIDTENARQLTYHFVESAAVHSKSLGWIPNIFVTLKHVPLVGPGEPETLKFAMDHKAAATFIEVLQEALDAAVEDARYGLRES